jgi:lactate dehydrogenase-like 2-hydroxyacid dehydrogenase
VEARLSADYEVCLNTDDRPRSRAELAEALQSFDAICPTITDRIDAELLGQPGNRRACWPISARGSTISIWSPPKPPGSP